MQQKLECLVTQTEWYIRREEDLREEQGGEGGCGVGSTFSMRWVSVSVEEGAANCSTHRREEEERGREWMAAAEVATPSISTTGSVAR